MAKIAAGLLSHSVAVSADGFNNLSDAGTSLVSLLGFKVAGYGGGSTHPFGHGRIEWIMGIFASIAVLLMGMLPHTYHGCLARAIMNRQTEQLPPHFFQGISWARSSSWAAASSKKSISALLYFAGRSWE